MENKKVGIVVRKKTQFFNVFINELNLFRRSLHNKQILSTDAIANPILRYLNITSFL